MAYLRAWAPTYRRETWSRALAALGVDGQTLGLELADAHLACFAASCRLYDDVVPALEQLGGAYALAVITNGPADVQRAKLRTSGLDRFFPTVLVSSEIGFAKPDERAFAAATRALGASTVEIVMIGDHLERDVIGARKAGITKAIWIDRTGSQPDTKTEVVHRITSLTQLVSALRTI